MNRPCADLCAFGFQAPSFCSTASATAFELPGFCPVMRFPSATTWDCQSPDLL